MMKQIIFIIYLSGFLMGSTCAQRKVEYIPADTLLQWFETYPPLEVLDKISDSRKEMDYKTYYHIPELKPYFMKWLDRDLYYEEMLKEVKHEYKSPLNSEDSSYLVYRIKGKLKLIKSPLNIDTVLSTPLLYAALKDSVINDDITHWVKEYEKKGKPFPSNEAIYHHARLKYPESYKIFYAFWKETGGDMKNDYFTGLVMMGDLKARKIYDEFIQEIVKKNGETNTLSFGLASAVSSYGVAKQIELLSVDKKLSPFSDDTFISFNCEVIDRLVSDIFYHKIEIDPIVKYRDPCEKDFEHLKEVKEAAQRLIKYYEKEEYYWMKNMPFYKE